MTDVSASVSASLTRYNMLSPGDRVGVGVSGGADSVTLLHVLQSQYRVIVLHVNHQLRGDESEADEAFVRALAAQLNLPIQVKQAPIPEGNMEQLARNARRAFFSEVREMLGLKRIALGHNQSDQAETVLYRFLRGSGLAGLAGMSPVTEDGLIRPMLDLTREEIRDWAKAQGIAWREDSSNDNRDLVRNRLRFEVFNPRLVQVLSANAEVAQDEETFWKIQIERLQSALVISTNLGLRANVADLNGLHPAEQRRLIRFIVKQVKGDLRSVDLSHIEAVRTLLKTENGHDRVLIPGVDFLRSFGALLAATPGTIGNAPRHYGMLTEIGKELALPFGNGRLYVNWIKPEDRICGNFGLEADTDQEVVDLDGDLVAGVGRLEELRVRNWEPGDEYLRMGHKKPEKIKSLFQEYRVVLWDRRRWPIVVLNEEIVWARRFGVAAQFQVSEATRSFLRLLYRFP